MQKQMQNHICFIFISRRLYEKLNNNRHRASLVYYQCIFTFIIYIFSVFAYLAKKQLQRRFENFLANAADNDKVY